MSEKPKRMKSRKTTDIRISTIQGKAYKNKRARNTYGN